MKNETKRKAKTLFTFAGSWDETAFSSRKEGLTANWLKQVEDAIEKRELLKINVLQNAIVEDEEVIEYIEDNSQIQVVQKIGHVLVCSSRPISVIAAIRLKQPNVGGLFVVISKKDA